MGAEIREITIPDLELNRIAHTITILAEMSQAMSYTYAEHHKEHGLDVRLNLALGRATSSEDYLSGATRTNAHHQEFQECPHTSGYDPHAHHGHRRAVPFQRMHYPMATLT